MSFDLIETALLLGVFVLLAGCYALFYTVGELRQSRTWINLSYVCYALQIVVTLLIVMFAPLGEGWQLLIIASCFACFKIPPVAFSYLELSHR
jgi:uncharacterized membrane protein HdeD (DUF308 family)